MKQVLILQDQKQCSNVKIILSIIYLGLCFLLLFCAELTFLNLISQIYNQYGFYYLGNMTILCLYLSFGIFNIFISSIINKYKQKPVLITCSFALTIFISLGIYVSQCKESDIFICKKVTVYTIVIILTLIAGCFGSLIWVQYYIFSAYLHDLCKIRPQNQGKYFGIFYGIMSFSQGLGAILAFILLKFYELNTFFIIMSFIGLMSFFQCCFCQNYNKNKNKNLRNYKIISMLFLIKKQQLISKTFYFQKKQDIICHFFIYKVLQSLFIQAFCINQYKYHQGTKEMEIIYMIMKNKILIQNQPMQSLFQVLVK
ncbi:major facilitator superfamily protein, putative [Ichthyophthirius multifiliis]|uniref:Major facilitator superfamily protein, putative n=1 Tax=Ichthyophthirius multifiliis TaxID=5932 RepID=G0QX02_ICHMU|nr:major facilitator superfamily protein, putative [Ichthyophthirius multifiliis]EGR30250.1 major facilitator superfamily protein, putative [Ichthyophthirius multifiliis]|eukprot:XP_004031846.1 major facilitator superfamily protein, putative [Ichthyophthirius multifiliis]